LHPFDLGKKEKKRKKRKKKEEKKEKKKRKKKKSSPSLNSHRQFFYCLFSSSGVVGESYSTSFRVIDDRPYRTKHFRPLRKPW